MYVLSNLEANGVSPVLSQQIRSYFKDDRVGIGQYALDSLARNLKPASLGSS